MKLKVRPGSHLSLTVTLSPAGLRRLFVLLLLVWTAVAIALYLLTEAAIDRWAPAAGHPATAVLVAFVWLTQLIPVLKRTRSVLGGLRDGLLYALVLGAGLVVAIHYAG